MKKLFCIMLAALIAGSCLACAKLMPLPKEQLETADQYQAWADETGYPSGALVDEGVPGLYQDRFRTLPGEPGYDSGRIVIGDSRCCQLGMYKRRAGLGDFAVFACWGGHYTDNEPRILTEETLSEIEACFRAQIEAVGGCSIWFFATVNDYDPDSADYSESVNAALEAIRALGSMSCEYEGTERHPWITVVGLEGCGEGMEAYGVDPERFNANVEAYDNALICALFSEAFSCERSMGGWGCSFSPFETHVDGRTGFIDDGLHYSDETLRQIIRSIIE